MFQIVNVINDEWQEVIAPHFVKLNAGDTWIHCGEADAEAIALHARLFRILGNTGNIYYVEPFETGDRINAVADINKQRSEDLTGAVFDLDNQREDIISALFELDARLEGIING